MEKEGGRWGVGCDLRFGLGMRNRKGEVKAEHPSVPSGAPSRLRGEGTAPTRFEEAS